MDERILVDEQACWRVALKRETRPRRSGYVECVTPVVYGKPPPSICGGYRCGIGWVQEGEREFGVKVNQIGILSRIPAG